MDFVCMAGRAQICLIEKGSNREQIMKQQRTQKGQMDNRRVNSRQRGVGRREERAWRGFFEYLPLIICGMLFANNNYFMLICSWEYSGAVCGAKLSWGANQATFLVIADSFSPHYIIILISMEGQTNNPHIYPNPNSIPPLHPSYLFLDSHSLRQLQKARQKFQCFLRTLGELKDTGILESIVAGCFYGQRRIKRIYANIKSEFIISALQARIEKMCKTRRAKRNWGEDDLTILVWVVAKICELHSLHAPERSFTGQQWAFVSSLIPGTTPSSCKFRWLNLKTTNLAHRHWTRQEQQILRLIVEEHLSHLGSVRDWRAISEDLYNRNPSEEKCYRSAKQCKEHWSCHLSPALRKGPWSLQEDLTLLASVARGRGRRWCELAKQLSGRTENAIKNRFSLLVEKERKLHKYRYMSQLELIESILAKHRDDLAPQGVAVEQMGFEEFKGGSLDYCQLEPGVLSGSFEFMRLEEAGRTPQGQCYSLQSLSMILDHCFS